MTNALETLKKILASDKIAKVNLKVILNGFIEGKCSQQLLGISDDNMQEFYEASLAYLNGGHYDEAADCFLFMLALNPLASNLWLQAGLAESHRLCHNEALEAYSMAMVCDPDDPFPHIYSSLIYIDRGEANLAQECLQVSLRLIAEQPNFHHLQEHVLELQQSIKAR